jgi:hypothetical protein
MTGNPNPGQSGSGLASGRGWRHWLGWLIQWTSYLSLGILVLGMLAYFTAPEKLSSALQALSQSKQETAQEKEEAARQRQVEQVQRRFAEAQRQAAEAQRQVAEQAQSERSGAAEDHWEVATWVANCLGYNNIEDAPEDIADWLSPIGLDYDYNKNAKSFIPPFQQRQIIHLSSGIYRQRIASALSVRAAYTETQIIQWIIIALGFLTTVVVSLSTLDLIKGRKLELPLRIFAIVLPVVGTAAAAINAFYNPSQELGAAKRSLASLGQLHDQIASEIWTLRCVRSTDPLDKAWTDTNAKIVQWSKRYQEIQSPAVEAQAAATGQQQRREKSK